MNFGGLSLPHVSTIKQQVTRTYLEVPLPYRVFDYKADLGGQGSGFTIDGFLPAFFGSIMLTVIHFVLGRIVFRHAGLLY